MRLLSFLSNIEHALIAESPVVDDGGWDARRMVNFHHGLARLTLTPRGGTAEFSPGGAIFVQAFELADGSCCLKASLNWKGSEVFPVFSVYSTPTTNWNLEASRIASKWLEGPPAAVTSFTATTTSESFQPLASSMG